MSDPENLYLAPEDFTGRARLFPLPNLVLFPHVLQPLHIFEPRYRAMLEDALAGDRLIAMATFAPGWEPHYEGRPTLGPVACLGRVATHHALENGRYNILLAGLQRAAIRRELPPDEPFRVAEVELLEDVYPVATAAERSRLQRQLIEAFRQTMPKLPEACEQLDQLLCGNVALGALTDIVGYTLDLDHGLKERLLGEPNVDLRATLLLAHLEGTSPPAPRGRVFPPEFSCN